MEKKWERYNLPWWNAFVVVESVKIRHVKELLDDSFALSDKSFLFTIENVEEGKKITNVLSSNDKLYLDHYDIVFENLWKKGIDIEDRIKEIEKEKLKILSI